MELLFVIIFIPLKKMSCLVKVENITNCKCSTFSHLLCKLKALVLAFSIILLTCFNIINVEESSCCAKQ